VILAWQFCITADNALPQIINYPSFQLGFTCFNGVQASEAQAAAKSMQDAAASIRKQVKAESSMMETHAALATELQAAESVVKVCNARSPSLASLHTASVSRVRNYTCSLTLSLQHF